MNRKPITLMFLVLLALAMVFSGCRNQSASPDLPDEEGLALEAEGNTTPVFPTEPSDEPTTPVDEPPADNPTPTPVIETPTPIPTEEPTPEPVEEPTEVPTLEPTVEPTEAPPVAAGPGKHIVQPGENLFRIALRYGTTVSELATANGITNVARIFPGQELVIPGGSGDGDTSPPPATGGEVVHVVQPGENLFRIALRYNYDQYYIARHNGISNPALIYPGQKIQIPQQ